MNKKRLVALALVGLALVLVARHGVLRPTRPDSSQNRSVVGSDTQNLMDQQSRDAVRQSEEATRQAEEATKRAEEAGKDAERAGNLAGSMGHNPDAPVPPAGFETSSPDSGVSPTGF